MRGGLFQLARIFGIPVQVHWSFLLVFVWVFFAGSSNGSWDWHTTGWDFLIVLALFVCVVLHEFGHALTARRYGVHTHDIILSPIGGVARLDRLPDKPWQEFMVAIAGPLVNIAIVLLLVAIFLLGPESGYQQFLSFFYDLLYPDSNVFSGEVSPVYAFFFVLIILNLVLAIFNMLPAFPMDGGRVLRALLSIRLGRLRATRIATYVGQGFALLLLAYAVWSLSPITGLIAVFIFMMAASEYRSARMESLMDNHTISEVVRRQFTRLYTNDSLPKALSHYQQGVEDSFLVFDEWQNLVGVLPENALAEAVKGEASYLQSVGELVSRRYEAMLASDPLKVIFAKIHGQGYPLLPVYEQGVLIGVVDNQALADFMRLHRMRGAK